MKKLLLPAFLLTVLTAVAKPAFFAAKDKKLTDRVMAWQIEHFTDSINPRAGWVNAAFYRGLAEWAARTDSKQAYDFLLRTGAACDWGMAERTYDADDLCIAQTYFKLYDKFADPAMIARVKERVDYVIAHPVEAPLLTAQGKYFRDRWGWCDALFMAPPVYARLYELTGDRKYLEFCLSEYRVTNDSLYDKSARLFFRDLRLTREQDANGATVFWGRGNGWVLAGLALLLEYVPESHPGYDYYRNLFVEMSEAVVACQDDNGSWHSSLHDPAHYPQPENSASAFFVYGLAWGVNRGILDDARYGGAARKGWTALKRYVDRDGRLGFVQPIGHAPAQITSDMTAPYGVGAFLLAASEVSRLK